MEYNKILNATYHKIKFRMPHNKQISYHEAAPCSVLDLPAPLSAYELLSQFIIFCWKAIVRIFKLVSTLEE
jgi:hypothetical protein